MLKLDLNLTKEQKSIRLSKLRNKFANYFGFVSSGSIAEALSFQQAVNTQRSTEPSELGPLAERSNYSVSQRSSLVVDRNATHIFNIMLDDGSGTRKALIDMSLTNPTEDLSITAKLSNLISTSVEPGPSMKRYVEMHCCAGIIGNRNQEVFHTDLDQIGFKTDRKEREAKNKLSVFRMQHPLLAPGEKNADLLTVFFNAFPALELTRATPVLNIKMYSSRQVFQDGKLAAISLQKFLNGAIAVPDDAAHISLRAIGLASQVTASSFGSTTEDFQNYSIVGMELFSAPQSLVNIDSTRIRENFLAPIIDPFRPLASIKSFDVDVKSAVGLISTKTAKLEIVLHDRSRLGEFADIVKPDRYGQSFIDAEYGWSHPDQLSADNPYADLLNLTRSKEHYNIVNSSFSFDDVGQVNITLNLITRGASEATELSITGNQDAVKQQLKRMEELSKLVNRLSGIVYGSPDNNHNEHSQQHRSEIRGQQMLGAAGDSTNFLFLDGDLLTSLANLRQSLHDRAGSSTSASSRRIALASRELGTALDELVGSSSARPIRTGARTGAGVVSNGQTQAETDAAAAANSQRSAEASASGQTTTPAVAPTAANSGSHSGSGGHSTQVVGGAVAVVQRTINGSINDSLRLINTTIGTDFMESDIFLKTMVGNVKTFVKSHNTRPQTERVTANVAAQTYGAAEESVVHRMPVVSLGTIFMNFVAKPLAMMENKFEEVQVYFYNFNNKASHMSHCNISQFPIYTEYFAREYSRLRLENMSRAVNLSVMDFIGFISSKMVDDSMNPAYGISGLYRLKHEGNEMEMTTSGRDDAAKQDNFNRLMRDIMTDANIGHSPDFQIPQLTVDLEAAPYVHDESKTILKIHIYDKTCSSTSPLRELLSLSTENLMSELSAFPSDIESANANEQMQSDNAATAAAANRPHTATPHHRRSSRGANTPVSLTAAPNDSLRRAWKESYEIIVNQAIRAGIIVPVDAPQAVQSPNTPPVATRSVRPLYRFVGGPKKLKEMVMKYVPHIIYGCMGTTVKSANLSTQQNAQLATINMLRNSNSDPVLANGEQAGGVPLSVYPCELSITTLGCPFVRYSQEVFVDFNTNTTADNIYFITGLQHKIEGGTYETTIKLTPNDAFGQYRNLIDQMNTGGNYLRDASYTADRNATTTPAQSTTSPGPATASTQR